MTYTLEQIAQIVNATVVRKAGIPDPVLQGIKPLHTATFQDLTFLANPKYAKQLPITQAGAVLLSEAAESACPTHALVVPHPYLALAKIAQFFEKALPAQPGIHPTAVIDPSAKLASSVSIGPHCVVGAECVIEEQVVLEAGVMLSPRVKIGAHTVLKSRVVVYPDVQIGEHCLIHSGAVLGSDGFGNANENGRWLKIPQLGSVVVGNQVEIGANTTIDRGALGDTEIHEGVKIDNLVQIAHNVVIGAHTAIAAQVGIAGSAVIGKYCMIGGGAGINGHITLADRVMITAKSAVVRGITEPGVYSSTLPAEKRQHWNRTLACLHRLDSLVKAVRQLKKQTEEDEAKA